MSTRRKIGDAVIVHAGTEDEFTGRIVAHSAGSEPDDCVYDCGDPDCREWPVLEVVDEATQKPTGERAFHVAECCMSSPAEK